MNKAKVIEAIQIILLIALIVLIAFGGYLGGRYQTVRETAGQFAPFRQMLEERGIAGVVLGYNKGEDDECAILVTRNDNTTECILQ